MISLDRAIEIAVDAHKGQRDKGNRPYILHPLRVMMKVIDSGESYARVAVLHDVPEDNPQHYPLDYFRSLLPDNEFDALDRLTKREGESRRENANRVKLNEISSTIKVADLEENLALTRLKNGSHLQARDMERIEDYLWCWHMLTGR